MGLADRDRRVNRRRFGRVKYPAVLLVAVLLGACGRPPEVRGSAGSDPGGESGQPRIVTLAPHLAELVYTAGAGAQLAGVVAYSDFPEPVRALPQVGDAFRVDLERLVIVDPDLVLAWDSGNPDAMVAQLRRRGYRVVVITTDTLDQVAQAIEQIGALAGSAAVAAAQATSYRERLGRLRQRYASATLLQVFYQVSGQPLYSIGKQHPITEMIEVCGGNNVFADIRQVAPVVAVEDVVLRLPDVIIAGDPPGQQLLDGWLQWPQIPAVRNRQLYTIDASLVARSSVRILDGLQAICTHLQEARSHAATHTVDQAVP